MFVLSSNPEKQTFKTPVRVEIIDGNGVLKTSVFKAVFKRLSREDLDDLNARLEKSRNLEPDADPAEKLTDAQVVREVMVGFEDVTDENGNEVKFSEANLEALMNVHPVRPTIVSTFFKAVYGAAIKN